MKTYYISVFLLVKLVAFSQDGSIVGNVIFSEDKYPALGLKLELFKNGQIVYETQTDTDGNYNLQNIPLGVYDLQMSLAGFRNKLVSSFKIDSEIKTVNFVFPDPCQKVLKICPNGHKDSVIPIVYGLPHAKTIRKSENGKVKLGGCDPSSCKKWHCKTHNLDF